MTELLNLQWDSLHRGLSLNNWIDTLTTQFKQSEQAALDTLLTLQYTLNDVWNDWSITAYVQAMIWYRRNAGLFTLNQLLLVWNKLNAELQHNVLQLKSDTTIASFMKQLKD